MKKFLWKIRVLVCILILLLTTFTQTSFAISTGGSVGWSEKKAYWSDRLTPEELKEELKRRGIDDGAYNADNWDTYGWAIKLNMPFEEGKGTIDVTQDSFGIISQYISMIYKWGAVVTGLLAVLMIVVWGVQYMIYGLDPGAKDDAKERIKQALLALTLLLLSGLLLRTINPDFFTF